ncbi:hypothetical protein [uncultured Sphingomonas sp.]|uniref:hypothetical protein n=1 Tax=uncultured Sphingomonas sp. TaxID=158754 RepID=UPI0025E3F004|nr:hypothetical protein [uncultured Sphingomonas sp.]
MLAVLPDMIGNTIGNLVAAKAAGGVSLSQRYDRIDAGVSQIESVVGSRAGALRVALHGLARDRRSASAKAAVYAELTAFLTDNRGNTAVEDFLAQIGMSGTQAPVLGNEVVLTGNRDYLAGALIDRSGIWLGKQQHRIGAAVGQFMADHPGAALTASIFDAGVTAIAPGRFLVDEAIGYFKEGISGWIAGKMEGPRMWTRELARAGGDGFVTGSTILASGVGALKGLSGGVAAESVPIVTDLGLSSGHYSLGAPVLQGFEARPGTIRAFGPAKGWSLGDDIYALTKSGNDPAWSTVRGRFWKNEAANTERNLGHNAT